MRSVLGAYSAFSSMSRWPWFGNEANAIFRPLWARLRGARPGKDMAPLGGGPRIESCC